MYYHQTAQGHWGHIILLCRSQKYVTFDLLPRSRDSKWPPTTSDNPKFSQKISNFSAIDWSISMILFLFCVLRPVLHM